MSRCSSGALLATISCPACEKSSSWNFKRCQTCRFSVRVSTRFQTSPEADKCHSGQPHFRQLRNCAPQIRFSRARRSDTASSCALFPLTTTQVCDVDVAPRLARCVTQVSHCLQLRRCNFALRQSCWFMEYRSGCCFTLGSAAPSSSNSKAVSGLS